jgi:hypothetical protein
LTPPKQGDLNLERTIVLTFALAHVVLVDETQQPIAGEPITLKWSDPLGSQHEKTVTTDDAGSALFPAVKSQMPLLPAPAKWQARDQSGEIQAGGNGHVKPARVVLKSA